MKFSPNLQNSEPPSSESKEGFCNCLCTNCNPLVEDERAALRWLDHVTGKLSPKEEKEWWDIGGTQHGLFAKRYNIAFCGYAAAALGMRGDEAQRRTVGRILGNCVERCLKKDIWAYSMSKNYWGRKPWAPDPCYRENVMYTGHLLQLMALYETFTGDRRYWTNGFDFVWSEKKRVHYDLKKLIDVTVFQMRHGPNGGERIVTDGTRKLSPGDTVMPSGS